MKMPAGWDSKAVIAAKKVEAKIDMGTTVVGKGMCPECRTPMVVATAAGHKVWCCLADRVALPIPNEALENEEAQSEQTQ